MPFTKSNIQSLDTWLPILNWPCLPNFAHCHTLTNPKQFLTNYYVSKDLATLYKNICCTMGNGMNAANIRITGDPGAGKTSFLYALKRMSEQGDAILNRFFFYIFHINRVEDGDATQHYNSEILHHISKAWKTFFIDSKKTDVYIRFSQQKLSDKDLINKLSEYYIDHKAEFSKYLVFIIDDVDLLPGDHVAIVADFILRNIEVASVKKWLVLRDITYDNYKGSTKQRIEQFFPDPYSFPSVSLYDLVKYRIDALENEITNKKIVVKNPFTNSLCDSIVKPICEGNMREGLSLLKSLLEDNLPKGIDQSTSEEFIQKYIDRASVNTFLKSHKLLDLHSDIFRVGLYPLAVDILSCALYHNSTNIIYGAVNDCAIKRDINASFVVGDENSTIKVRTSDFEYVLDKLADHGLVKIDKKAYMVRLTERGKIMAAFAVKAHYMKFCQAKEHSVTSGKEYWELATKEINHQKIVATYLAWKNLN